VPPLDGCVSSQLERSIANASMGARKSNLPILEYRRGQTLSKKKPPEGETGP